jgi:hypothetical protein
MTVGCGISYKIFTFHSYVQFKAIDKETGYHTVFDAFMADTAWSRVLLEKPTGSQLVKKYPTL